MSMYEKERTYEMEQEYINSSRYNRIKFRQ